MQYLTYYSGKGTGSNSRMPWRESIDKITKKIRIIGQSSS